MTQPQPVPCEPDIFKDGESVCSITGPRSFTIEDWIVKVRAASGQRVDWHYVGGYAHVLVLGDKRRVREAIERLRQELIDAYMACSDNLAVTAELSPRNVSLRFL